MESGLGSTQIPTGGIGASGQLGVEEYKPQPFGTLKYPIDLQTDRDGSNTPDAVCFTIMKRIGVSVEDVTAAASGVWEMGKGALEKGFGDKDITMDKASSAKIAGIMGQDISDEKKRQLVNAEMKQIAEAQDKPLPDSFFELAVGAVTTFKTRMGGAQDVAAKRRKIQKKALEVRKPSSDILGNIYMNMPAGIQFSDKAKWGSDPLGLVGKFVKDTVGGGEGVSAGGTAAGMGGTVAAAGIGGIGALVAKMGLKGSLIGAGVAAAAGGTAIQKGAEAALGISMNPFLEMMFTGIDFRDMQFDFTMRPRSANEFTAVGTIINLFREHSRPSWTGGKLGKNFMNYPMVYNIQFLTSSGQGPAESYVRNSNIPKLKTCVCDSVTTNFSPQNMWTSHNHGVPVAVTLGLHFQETELVMAKDVRDGNF